VSIPTLNNVLLTATSSSLLITFSWSGGDSSWYVLGAASPAVSVGRMTPAQAFTNLQFTNFPSASFDIYTAWVSHFGVLPSGLKVWVRICAINIVTGQRSMNYFASDIV
jgi:hypothetical protein